jgi:lantibiotic transport system ATP-binding protein
MYAIEAIGVSHHFSKNEKVLDNIHFSVKEGCIYGFLGPNGAGKTTTLRLILGLLQKQEGEIRVFGKPFDQNRTEILRGIGSLIESPSLYGHGGFARYWSKKSGAILFGDETTFGDSCRPITSAEVIDFR